MLFLAPLNLNTSHLYSSSRVYKYSRFTHKLHKIQKKYARKKPSLYFCSPKRPQWCYCIIREEKNTLSNELRRAFRYVRHFNDIFVALPLNVRPISNDIYFWTNVVFIHPFIDVIQSLAVYIYIIQILISNCFRWLFLSLFSQAVFTFSSYYFQFYNKK